MSPSELWDFIMDVDLTQLPTPCYVVDQAILERNLEILDSVQKRSGCKIIMALKGFAMFSVFPIIRRYLQGIAASSVDEARLGFEEFGKEVHVCAPAYRDSEFNELLNFSSHIVFNSFSQWDRFKSSVRAQKKEVLCGIRVNPEHSEVKIPIYDPCRASSRLGVTRENFQAGNLEGITGLHFHNLCELNADALARTLAVFEKSFGELLTRDAMGELRWWASHHSK